MILPFMLEVRRVMISDTETRWAEDWADRPGPGEVSKWALYQASMVQAGGSRVRGPMLHVADFGTAEEALAVASLILGRPADMRVNQVHAQWLTWQKTDPHLLRPYLATSFEAYEVERFACWVDQSRLVFEPDDRDPTDPLVAPRWCVFGSDTAIEGRVSLFDCETLEECAAMLSALLARPISLEPGQGYYYVQGNV